MNASGVAKAALLGAAGSAIAGAIGASAASGGHPIIKGALVTGVIGGTLELVRIALMSDPNATGVSGCHLSNATPPTLRFP